MTYIDWHRKRCFVEPVDESGRARWNGFGAERVRSFTLTRATRDVLLGEDPPVRLTNRASLRLAEARETFLDTVHPGGTLIVRRDGGDIRWWTWAGHRANATLSATLPSVVVPHRRTNGDWIRLREDLTPPRWQNALRDAQANLALPQVASHAIRGLKFSEALPSRLAEATLAARLMDSTGAETALTESIRLSTLTDR